MPRSATADIVYVGHGSLHRLNEIDESWGSWKEEREGVMRQGSSDGSGDLVESK